MFKKINIKYGKFAIGFSVLTMLAILFYLSLGLGAPSFEREAYTILETISNKQVENDLLESHENTLRKELENISEVKANNQSIIQRYKEILCIDFDAMIVESPGKKELSSPCKSAVEKITSFIVPKAHAESDSLIFGEKDLSIGEFSFKKDYWVLKEDVCKDSCGYKNDIIIRLQKALTDKIPGISQGHLKQFTMQMYAENGALDIWSTKGDKGKAVGLGQWNVPNAASWLAKNCAKDSLGKCDYTLELERQINRLSDDMARNYKTYKGDIRLAIIHHNRPASARRGADQCLAGPTDYDDSGIFDCYYKDQVLRHDKSFVLLGQ